MSDDLVKEWDNHIHVMSEVYAHANKMANRIEELEAQLAAIEEYGTEEINEAVALRQKLEAAIELLGDWRLVASGYLSVQAIINKHDATLAKIKIKSETED